MSNCNYNSCFEEFISKSWFKWKKVQNYKLKKLLKKLKPCLSMDKKITFDDTEIEEYKFYWYKGPFQ